MLLSMLFLTLTASQPLGSGGAANKSAAVSSSETTAPHAGPGRAESTVTQPGDADALKACDTGFDHCTIDRDAAQKALATCNSQLAPAARDPAVPGWITTVASTAVAAAGAVAYADGHHTTGAVMVAVGIVGDGVGLLLLR